ncbi:glycerophosphocholine phosphodiesterase GPCPD1 [Condylostylus longicornis]|uniref:glycerophosphocholine phosphodiesterase GPCPD1 n=1 Tax=Condylostylus longicornis TaxID=2530218 RepID=UPI00244DD894|nr:glycerophosphocholine phosphodiesterase GPCPD1 [Condylostylus longicornis]XP_055376160.1 glycerophosphocholine phosphodiesterase GPCPD1 [Condylostylus longicornis]XP_055376161.1 glycerophosphocholine phosphodiesterase GPCPD1 [Condylostylus longicornis]XP_055376162.1 glycerophosphocholine phosphodiesterase GPCPD1 [Condylostylus longicornis]XP_055376163.1 glycerophosphocholine phosphodiesterase GPCPD1 [Condylostylus longicornis]
MQNWFYVDDVAEHECHLQQPSSSSTSSLETNSSVRTTKWHFLVVVHQPLQPNEKLAITGDCTSLGNWQLEKCLVMNKDKDDGTTYWSATVENIPRDREVPYRYLICAIDPINDEKIVRTWETHFNPRVIPVLDDRLESNDVYGEIAGVEKIDRGWLTSETVIQLKFFNSPFKWKQRMKNRLVYVKVTPMSIKINCNDTAVAQQTALSPLEDSLSNDTRENGGTENQSLAFAEVVNFNYEESNIKPQSQFGIQCGPSDIVMFHITVKDPENTAYLIDLYTYSSKSDLGEPPYHLGYHYILPNALKRSEGVLDLPITCASKHRPMGMMQVGYLIIKPFAFKFDMKKTYERYWNKKWTGLDVGHRGSGTSFKAKDTVIRENTIGSLKKAAAHGADMVEFDVQLSKDLVPVIYHDFHVYVSLKSKKEIDINDFLELPMRELTLEQLKTFKVYHVVEGRTREPRNFENDDMNEHQPFPQLADVLDALDPHVGFNIEIKWSQELVDGTIEAENPIDRNLYIDCILDVVLHKAGQRRIVFSCFDADVCSMLRFKQNIYPVMFLTLGETERYVKYRDPRCNTLELAVCNARAFELLGIVAHTEDLLKDPSKINLATNRGLIIFCWGDDNNSKDTIKMLKSMGLHAIIYDKMDVLTPKENRESVFLIQARDKQSEFFQLQCLELAGKNWYEDRRPLHDDENRCLELEKDCDKNALSTSTSILSLVK